MPRNGSRLPVIGVACYRVVCVSNLRDLLFASLQFLISRGAVQIQQSSTQSNRDGICVREGGRASTFCDPRRGEGREEKAGR